MTTERNKDYFKMYQAIYAGLCSNIKENSKYSKFGEINYKLIAEEAITHTDYAMEELSKKFSVTTQYHTIKDTK